MLRVPPITIACLLVTACSAPLAGDGPGTAESTGNASNATVSAEGDSSTGDGDSSAGGTTGDGDGTTGDGTNGDGTTGDGTSGDGDGTTGDGTTGDGTTGDGDGTSGDGTTGDGTSGDGDGTTGDGTTGDGTTGDGDGTAGCGMTWSPGASSRSVSVGGTVRDYLVVIPAGYDPNQAYPVIFAWHGQGGDGALARLYFGIEQASNDQAILIYPDGLPQASVGGETGWDLSSSGDDILFFDAMLAEVGDSTCVDPLRVFSTGHSFGGYMSNALACFRGDDLRAIGSVAGGPSFGFSPCVGTVAAWVAHDPTDMVVEFSQGTMARDQHLTRNGCASTTSPTTPTPCVAYDGCAGPTPVVWCDHSDGGFSGHDWPGFAGTGIWAFFAGQ